MKAKRMKKLLMAAGAERNLANKITEACHEKMSHEDMFWTLLFAPKLLEVFRDAVRYGVGVKASFESLQDGEAFLISQR